MIVNDYIVNNKKKYCEKSQRLFVIFFNMEIHKYYIRSLNENFRILIKINNSFVIPTDTKEFFSLNIILLSCLVLKENKEIIVTVYYKEGKKEYKFNQNKSTINIGRKKTCDVVIKFPLISKIHCSIKYNSENNNWSLEDGLEKKKSTNGTWLWVLKKQEIFQDINYIKLGKDIVKVSYIN